MIKKNSIFSVLLGIMTIFIFNCGNELSSSVDGNMGLSSINKSASNSGFIAVGTTPFFIWPAGAPSYWLLVGTSRDFDNGNGEIKINESNVGTNYYQSTTEFAPGTYFWKVKYKAGAFEDWYWSDTYEFTISADPYSASGNPPKFTWPGCAPVYWLLLSDNEKVAQGKKYIDAGYITSNVYQSNVTLPSGTYYWKVKFKISNDSTLGNWSKVQKLIIK